MDNLAKVIVLKKSKYEFYKQKNKQTNLSTRISAIVCFCNLDTFVVERRSLKKLLSITDNPDYLLHHLLDS